MSDEQPAADAGPVATSPVATYSDGKTDLHEVAKQVREKRGGDDPPSAERPTAESQMADHAAETRVSWQDGRPPDHPRTVKETAEALKDYHLRQEAAKRELAEQLRAEEAEAPAEQAEQPAEQPVEQSVPEQPYDPERKQQLTQQIEREQQQQQLREGWQQADAQSAQIEQSMRSVLESVLGTFPELNVRDPVARRAALEQIRKDPHRAAQFDSIDQHFRQLEGARNELRAYQGQLANYAASQVANDKATQFSVEEKAAEQQIYKLDPDLKNNTARQEELKRAFFGKVISPAEFKKRQHAGQLDREALLVLYKAARWEQAQDAAREVIRKPLPPVQRPGVSGNRNGAANQSGLFQQLHAASGTQRSTRIAAELMKVQRAARNRGH